MKAIEVNNEILVFKEIPNKWGNTFNYNKLDSSKHINDGFRELIKPVLSDNQKLGAIFYDGSNDYFTYNIINLTQSEIDEKESVKSLDYKRKIEDSFSYLYVRALASSMNKSKLDLSFLTAQREVYEDKYKVSKGQLISGVVHDNTLSLIQAEMNDEFSEAVLDTILTEYGVTPTGSHLNKMFQLIVFKFEYGLGAFSSYKKFMEHFRTKALLWLDNKEWSKIDSAISLVEGMPSSLTLAEAESLYNQFNTI